MTKEKQAASDLANKLERKNGGSFSDWFELTKKYPLTTDLLFDETKQQDAKNIN